MGSTTSGRTGYHRVAGHSGAASHGVKNRQRQEYVRTNFDYTLLLATILLVALGLTIVYSATGIMGRERFNDGFLFLKKEMIALVIGIITLLIAKNVPIEWIKKSVYPIFGISLILLVLVMIPGVGVRIAGAQRWLRFGPISIQPSEIAKLALLLFVAYSLSKKQEKIHVFLVGFMPPMMISGLLLVLVLAGKDLGNAVVMGLTLFMMMYVGGTKKSYLAWEALLALPAFYYLVAGEAYRRQRILAFLNPWDYEKGAGFQIIQSYLAFYSGGLFGQGLGEGKQKLFYLPEAHTDFIFSVIGEELGLAGTFVIVVLFGVWIYRAFHIAWNAKDIFSSYLALGIATLFGFQVVFNIAVVMGLLPTKGLALPFLSYGGTALITSLTCVGLLLNISTRQES